MSLKYQEQLIQTRKLVLAMLKEGSTVLINQQGVTQTTTETVKVLPTLQPKDPLNNSIHKVLRDLALEMMRQYGDGSKSAVLLACDYALKLQYSLNPGSHGPIESRPMDPLELTDYLYGVTSVQEVAEAVSEALGIAAEDEVIQVIDSDKIGVAVAYQNGYMLEGLRLNCEGVTREAVVALSETGLCNNHHVQKILEGATQWNDRHLILVAPYVTAEALRCIQINNADRDRHDSMRQRIYVLEAGIQIHKDVNFGPLHDIATLGGGTVWEPMFGAWDDSYFSFFKNIEVNADGHAVFNAYPDVHEDESSEVFQKVEARMSQLTRQAQSDPINRVSLLTRVTKMAGSTLAIRVKAVTDSETKFLRGEVDRSLRNASEAITHGLTYEHWLPEADGTFGQALQYLSEIGIGDTPVCHSVAEAVIRKGKATGELLNSLAVHVYDGKPQSLDWEY
jgi:DNA-directed RNA polymerase subunit H (RpoH/RPB5)